MGFQKSIRAKILLEWKEAYISYTSLKMFFKPFKTTAKLILEHLSKPKTSHDKISFDNISLNPEEKAQLKGFYVLFKQNFSKEIEKTNSFLKEKVVSSEKEWALIKKKAFSLRGVDKNIKEFQDFKVVFHLFYLKLGYILSFYHTNEHILAHTQIKFNTLLIIFQDFLFIKPESESINFVENPMKTTKNKLFNQLSKESLRTLNILLQKARHLYLALYYKEYTRYIGDNKLKDLFRQTQHKVLSSKSLYKLYFFLGVGFALLIMIIMLIYNDGLDPDSDDQAQKLFKYHFPIFRGFLFIVLYLALLAFNVYGWLQKQVNYRAVFGFYKHYSIVSMILKRVLFFSSLWLFTFLIFLIYTTYYGSQSLFLGFLPLYYLSGLNWLFFIIYMFFPSTRYFNGKGRLYTFKIIWKVLAKSWKKVDFSMIFVLNQFTSFVLALKDLEYTMCYYISIWLHPENDYPYTCLHDSFQIGFVFAFIPLFLRIVQCIRIAYDRKNPHQKRLDIVNIFKFVTSGIVTILSLVVSNLQKDDKETYIYVFYIWIFAAMVSTIYSYIWDIKMGWALCEKGYGLLRARMHYNKWIYYFAIFFNFIFRITWMLNISPGIINSVLWRPEFTAFLVGFCEMLRRTIWNFLRLDKETVMFPDSYRLIPNIALLLLENSPMDSLDAQVLNKSNGDFVRSTFSLEDLLMKKGYMSSLDDLLGVKYIEKNKIERAGENEEWEFLEKNADNEWDREKTKKEIKVFENKIINKSRKNTFLVSGEENIMKEN